MRHGLIACSAQTDLWDVARMMASNHVHAVVVLSDEASGPTAWGVVSDLDMLRVAHPGVDEPMAGEVAATPPVTVAPEDSLPRAAQVMREQSTSHLVVIDSVTGQPVGVVSTLDIARALARGED